MGSNIIISTAMNNHARIYLADTTDLVETARLTHDLWPSSCTALGRMLSITSVMGSMLKNEHDSITTSINGGGPIGSLICTVKGNGKIKGFCSNNAIYLMNNNKKLIVGGIVGNQGHLKVIKDLKMKNNYVSEVKLQTGEISEDFAYYYRLSEQTPCIISSGVLTGQNYHVVSAGCIFIELMPGYIEEDIDYLERVLKKINDISLTSLIVNHKLNDYISSLFTDYIVLETKPVSFECDCSRERFYNNLYALPINDLIEINNNDSVEIKCEFCNKKYIFSKNDIESIIDDKNRAN